MSSPTATPSILNRNTLIQRASRERRKNYIQGLERRVHAYEAQGVQATTEVQVAARKVADENRALKVEITHLREKCAVLEQKIQSFTQHDGGGIGQVRGDMTDVSRRRACERPKSRRTQLDIGRHPVAQNTHFERSPQALQQPQAVMHAVESSKALAISALTTGSTSSPHSPPRSISISPMAPHELEMRNDGDVRLNTEHDDVALSSEEDSLLQPPSYRLSHSSDQSPLPEHYLSPPTSQYPSPCSSQPTSSPCHSTTPPNSTPCLEAALIIASMRGLSPTDSSLETDILPELGCTGPLERPTCLPGGRGCGGRRVSIHGYRDDSGNWARDMAVDLSNCAVDNGRLFGILAQEG